jgi:hypothetical protein
MQENEPEGRHLISTRTMEILTAIFFLTMSAIVITDALRLGISWNFDGPAAGYFPFYIACVMGGASLINLVQALLDKNAAGETFVTVSAFGKVLQVLIPLAIYVAVVPFAGIYVSSAIYIALFMWWFGGYAIYKAIPVGLGVSFFLFMMFEVWFLTPLPKGPLEAALGY